MSDSLPTLRGVDLVRKLRKAGVEFDRPSRQAGLTVQEFIEL